MHHGVVAPLSMPRNTWKPNAQHSDTIFFPALGAKANGVPTAGSGAGCAASLGTAARCGKATACTAATGASWT